MRTIIGACWRSSISLTLHQFLLPLHLLPTNFSRLCFRRPVYVDAVARAIICGKPEMRIGEIAIVAALKSELPPATLWSTERRS